MKAISIKCLSILILIIVISIPIESYAKDFNFDYSYYINQGKNNTIPYSDCKIFGNDIKFAASCGYTLSEFLGKIGLTRSEYNSLLTRIKSAINKAEEEAEDEGIGSTQYTQLADNITKHYNEIVAKKDNQGDTNIGNTIVNNDNVGINDLINTEEGGDEELGREVLSFLKSASEYMGEMNYGNGEYTFTQQSQEHKKKGNQLKQTGRALLERKGLSEEGKKRINSAITGIEAAQDRDQENINKNNGKKPSSSSIDEDVGKVPSIDFSNPADYNPGDLTMEEVGNLTTVAGKILGMVNTVGVVISVIALTLIGVKYMFGSVDEKANYKQTMIPYCIGAVLLMTGTTVVNILYQLGKSLW